jgi:hydroxymethylbilane synthase
VLAALDDLDSRTAVLAERSLLAALEAGCSAPVAALAEVVEGEQGIELSLRAFVGSLDGALDLRRSVVGPVSEAERLGADLAAVLLEDGADVLTTPEPRPTARRPAGWNPDPAEASRDSPPLAAPTETRPEPTATERAP